jgi:hypothetical protein
MTPLFVLPFTLLVVLASSTAAINTFVKMLHCADHHPIEQELLVAASPVMRKSRAPAGGNNYPENGPSWIASGLQSLETHFIHHDQVHAWHLGHRHEHHDQAPATPNERRRGKRPGRNDEVHATHNERRREQWHEHHNHPPL